MKRKLIVGNWKMHLNTAQASLLLHRLEERIQIHDDVEVVLAPSMLLLQPLSIQLDRRKFRLAAQNAFYEDEGPFTGEVSFAMLQDLVHYAIIGHSERRHVFNEDLKTIQLKMRAAVRNDIVPILCVGETKHERLMGETKRVIHDQLTTAIHHLTSDELEEVVIAYEPVWAISNGANYSNHVFADPDDVQREIDYIRQIIADLYGAKASERVRVLYGGSSNAENARAYLTIPGVDGLLPGGASLNYHEFSAMVDTAYRVQHEQGDKG